MDAELWSQRYITGHAGIDAQHRVLFALLARVRREVAQTGDHRQVVLDLMKYVVEHFNYELSLMRQSGYEQVMEHHDSHQRLLGEVLALKQIIFSRGTDHVALEAFIGGWIQRHIGDDDRRLAEFLIDHGFNL